jgi:hypothetical protein
MNGASMAEKEATQQADLEGKNTSGKRGMAGI